MPRKQPARFIARLEIVLTPRQKQRLNDLCREDDLSHGELIREYIDNDWRERHPHVEADTGDFTHDEHEEQVYHEYRNR